MINSVLKAASILSAAMLLTATAPDASARQKPPPPYQTTVDCDAGESIMSAIEAGYTWITVAGVCDENVRISIDGLTLVSDEMNPGSIVASGGNALSISGAEEVFVDGLTIESVTGQYGIITTHAQAGIQRVDLVGGTVTGLAVRSNSSISFTLGTISNALNGATVFSSSSLGIANSTISGSSNAGAIATGASYLSLFNTHVDGSAVAGDNTGVAANTGATVAIDGGSVTDFGDAGVTAIGATIRIDGAAITNNGNTATPDYPGDGGVIAAAGSSVYISQSANISNNNGYGLAVIEGSGGACRWATIENNSVADLFVDPISGLGQAGGCTLSP